MPNYNYLNYPYGATYNPYGNQPNYNQQLNYAQQPQQPQQAQQSPMAQCAFVNGIEGAKAFQMMPNQTLMLMDSENPFVYMKQSNSMGQSTLKYFKLIETNEQEIRKQNNPQPNQQSNVEYALKSDLEALNKKMDELSSKLEKPLKEE